MNLWQKILRCGGLTPGNVISYLSLQHMYFWGKVLGTLRLRCKAVLLGVHLGQGVRAHGPVGLLRWPGSHIEIGDGVSIISSWRRSTACTLAAPTRLRTFGPKAVISIGAACELSGTSIGTAGAGRPSLCYYGCGFSCAVASRRSGGIPRHGS